MALTGSADGPAMFASGHPATVAKAAALAFELITEVAIDGPALLGERAALVGLNRRGRISAGGGTRLLRAADGWWALNLTRDIELVPALTETRLTASTDPWIQTEDWASTLRTADVIARTALLGMAAAELSEVAAPGQPWRIHRFPASRSSVIAPSTPTRSPLTFKITQGFVVIKCP